MLLGRVSIDTGHCPACPAVNDEGHEEEAWSVRGWLICLITLCYIREKRHNKFLRPVGVWGDLGKCSICVRIMKSQTRYMETLASNSCWKYLKKRKSWNEYLFGFSFFNREGIRNCLKSLVILKEGAGLWDKPNLFVCVWCGWLTPF